MIEPPPTDLKELIVWREKYRKYIFELANRIFDYVKENGPTRIDDLMIKFGERRTELYLAIMNDKRLVLNDERDACYAANQSST
jgi:hypothetical protein